MSADTVTYLINFLGFAGFLWIGLYAVARGDRGRLALLTGATAVSTGCFFFFNSWLKSAYGDPAVALNHCSWWASVLPATLWSLLSMELDRHAMRVPWRTPFVWANVTLATLLVTLGTFTNLVRDYAHPAAGHPVGAGPLFVVYVAYLLACFAFSAFCLIRMALSGPHGEQIGTMPGSKWGPARDAQRWRTRELRQMVVGALCFLTGAAYLAVNELLGGRGDQWPGLALLLVGLGVFGATVSLRTALLLGKDLRRDFVYSFTALVLMILPALIVLGLLDGFGDERRGLAALLVVGAITTGHTLRDSVRERLDLLFFSPAIRQERAAARAYEEALAAPPAGRNPVLSGRKEFDDAVRRALTNLSDPTRLATSPLLNLHAVSLSLAESGQDDNRLNRAAVLKEMLLDLLDQLRPGAGAGTVTGDAHRFYNCLYYPYVKGISRRRLPSIQRHLQERRCRDGSPKTDQERVVDWLLQLDETTFYRWQRRGSDTIAAALREREVAAGGTVPECDSVGGDSGRPALSEPLGLSIALTSPDAVPGVMANSPPVLRRRLPAVPVARRQTRDRTALSSGSGDPVTSAHAEGSRARPKG